MSRSRSLKDSSLDEAHERSIPPKLRIGLVCSPIGNSEDPDLDFDLPGSRQHQRVVIRPLAGARGYRKVQSSNDVGIKHSLGVGRNGARICATIATSTSARKSDTKTPRSAHATGRKDFMTVAAQRTRVACRCPGIVRRYWQSCPPSPNPCGCISDTAARRPRAARSSSPPRPT